MITWKAEVLWKGREARHFHHCRAWHVSRNRVDSTDSGGENGLTESELSTSMNTTQHARMVPRKRAIHLALMANLFLQLSYI